MHGSETRDTKFSREKTDENFPFTFTNPARPDVTVEYGPVFLYDVTGAAEELQLYRLWKDGGGNPRMVSKFDLIPEENKNDYFWGIYLRGPDHCARHIADRKTRADCEETLMLMFGKIGPHEEDRRVIFS